MAARASLERTAEILESLAEIRSRILAATSLRLQRNPTLVAVSKYKAPSDILACYEGGQHDFGENYVQELVDKAAQLPGEIRWHFIGTLQFNKAKFLASVPNLHMVQTVTSEKVATALNKALPSSRSTPLNLLIQINTSGESTKSGLLPLSASSSKETHKGSDVYKLSKHIIATCPRIRFQGLMTIGALTQSINAETEGNKDFETLKETRDVMQGLLEQDEEARGKWGEGGQLLLSMGMSSDFEAALRAGSDIVRVGSAIFGERPKKADGSRSPVQISL